MIRFSDIPEFILNTYLDAILVEADETTTTVTDMWEQVLFVDTVLPFTDTDFVIFNLSYTIGDDASQTNSYLMTPGQHIVTKGGKRLEAYVETDTEYQEIGLSVATDYQTDAAHGHGSHYTFGIYNSTYPTSSADISYTLTASSSGDDAYTKYEFVQYDCFSDPTYKTIDTKDGYNVFIRKGSTFHEWGDPLYPDQINFNKDYIQLGQIYPYESEWQCRIFRYLLKDNIMSFLPDHNRTDNLAEFIKVAFDQVYNKIYKQQKNLKTLYDPSESEPEYLDDLTKGLYGTDIDLYALDDEERLRDLTRNMPIILKKKGTYSSLIGIWKFVSGFDDDIDNRDINIYEWWHDTLASGTYTVPTSGFDEINYINQYDTSASLTGCAGASYYSTYSSDYPSFYSSNLYSTAHNAFIHKQTEASTEWTAKHWVNDDQLLVQCFNANFQEIVPATVEIQDNSVCNLTFTEATSGYCVVSKVNYGELRKGVYWDISHYINKKMVMTQAFNTFNERFSPINIYKKDNDDEVITVDQDDGYGYFLKGDYIYHSRTAQTTWTVNHNINALMLTQCYDSDDNQIVPSSVDQSDFKTTVITFNQAVSGYVILKRIGNPIDDVTQGKILSPHYKIEVDLTCKPIDPASIFSHETAQNLYDNWESVRSADRVAHYHAVFAPKVDFSTSIVGTYGQQYTPYWLSRCVVDTELDDIAVYSQTTSTSAWEIKHNLKTKDLTVFVYDADYEQISPFNITVDDFFTVTITFDEDTLQAGHAVLVVAEQTEDISAVSSNIVHTWDRNVLSQFYTLDKDNSIFPETITSNENSLFVSGSEEGTAHLVEGDLLWTQTTSASTWSISHGFKSNGVVVEFFDSNWTKIIPDTFTLTDIDNCTATFSSAIAGYCVIKDVGYLSFRNEIIDDVTTNGVIVKLGDGTTKSYIDGTVTDVQSELVSITVEASDCYTYGTDVYIDVDLDLNTHYDITEMGIFNSNETKMYFYSQGSEICKNLNYTMTVHYSVLYSDI